MPDMDGLGASQAIRTLGGRKAEVAIIAITASAQPRIAERCLRAGMNDCLAKPVTPDTLFEAIAKCGSVRHEDPARVSASRASPRREGPIDAAVIGPLIEYLASQRVVAVIGVTALPSP